MGSVKYKDFVLFFETKPEKYCRYIKLLFDGGRFVLRGILDSEIAKRSQTLELVLVDNKELLKEKFANQEMFKQLFVETTDNTVTNTDSETWDIIVLAVVITNILDESVDELMAANITTIKEARIQYANNAMVALDSERFNVCCEDLISSIRVLSFTLGKNIYKKCNEVIAEYRDVSDCHIGDVDQYLEVLKEHGSQIQTIAEVYMETLSTLKTSVKRMEDEGVIFKRNHVLELKMLTLGDNKQKTEVAEDALETVWQAALKMSDNPTEFEDVRKAVDIILEYIRKIPGVEVKDVEHRCILLRVNCYSWRGLFHLMQYFESSQFQQHLRSVANELSFIYEDFVHVVGHITIESVLNVLNNLVNTDDECESFLRLPIRCSSAAGMRKVLEVLGNESTISRFNEIADSLSAQVKGRITLDTKTDVKGFSGVFEESDDVGTVKQVGMAEKTHSTEETFVITLPMTRNRDLMDVVFENCLNDGHEDLFKDKIQTDWDEAKDVDISLMEYQKELAKEVLQGENGFIIAPNISEITILVCGVMQNHLRLQRQSMLFGKVVCVEENEVSALRQGEACTELLPAYRSKVITRCKPVVKELFGDILERVDILVVTAKLLHSVIKEKGTDCLIRTTLIVFDEPLDTDNLFGDIMNQYVNLKLRENLKTSALPQVIDLTTSYGVGETSNEDTFTRDDKISELRHGLLKNEIVIAKNRQKDQFKQAILDIIRSIDKHMRCHENIQEEDQSIINICQIPPNCGTRRFSVWLTQFQRAIDSVRSAAASKMMKACCRHLQVYNRALQTHAAARITDAEAILEESLEKYEERDREDETDEMLIGMYRSMKTRNFEDEPENPKLLKMKELLMDVLGNDDNARCIIFVRTFWIALALSNWMRETVTLNLLNVIEFVGQAASSTKEGMAKSMKRDLLQYFEDGRHTVIVTTAEEEELDTTPCNLVIRYEYVTNEIVRLQCRGRARAINSRHCILTTEGSWIVVKEQKDAMVEILMKMLSPPALQLNSDKDLRERKRQADATVEDMEFRCLNCNQFICMSSDIRKIYGKHHVIVDGVKTRLLFFRGPEHRFLINESIFGGGIFCGNMGCQTELGAVCEYGRLQFPLPKIRFFRVVDKYGAGRTFKHWKRANFVIESITLEDLKFKVERK